MLTISDENYRFIAIFSRLAVLLVFQNLFLVHRTFLRTEGTTNFDHCLYVCHALTFLLFSLTLYLRRKTRARIESYKDFRQDCAVNCFNDIFVLYLFWSRVFIKKGEKNQIQKRIEDGVGVFSWSAIKHYRNKPRVT